MLVHLVIVNADDHGPLKVFSTSESDFEEMDSSGPVMVAPIMIIPGMTGGIARLEKGPSQSKQLDPLV